MRLCYCSLLLFLVPLFVSGQEQYAVAAWKVSYDSAQFYWNGNTQKSVSLLQKAERVAFHDLGIYDENYLTILNDLGLAYGQVKNYRKAEEYLARNLSIQQEFYNEENSKTLQAACNLATIVLKSGDYIRARKLYKHILAKSEAIEAGEVYRTAAENLSNLYEVREQYDSALMIIQASLNMHSGNPSLATGYQLHLAEARILRKLKRYPESAKALEALTKSIHSTSLNIPALRYAVQMEQSLIHLETGLYSQAEKELLELYRTLKSEKETHEELLTELTNSVAYAYEKLGIYDKALLYYQESFSRCLKSYGYNSLSCAIMQNNMAGIMLRQGKAEQAIAQYREFIEAYKSLSQQSASVYFTALSNLATAYRQTGQYEKAMQQYTGVYAGLQELHEEKSDLAATVMNNMAVTFMLQGEYEKAAENFEKVIAIKAGFYGKDSPVLLDAIENLAVTYWASGRYEAALPLFRQSLAITERGIRYIFPNLTESEQVQFYQRQRLSFERFNTLALQHVREIPELKKQMFNNQLLLKSIVFFTNKKRDERVRGNAQLKVLVERAQAARVQLGHFYQLPAEELQRAAVSTAKLEHEIDSLEKIIRHALADKSPDGNTYAWQDVQRTLKADEALVDIIRFRKYDVFKTPSELLSQQVNTGFTDSIYYAALITTAETIENPTLVLLKNGRMLETLNHRFYINTLKFDVDDTVSYAQYWLPIEKAISGKKKIYITPDGVYHQVNLNVIRDRNNQFILEKFDLHTLMNPVQLVNRAEPVNIDFTKSVLFGDPVFGTNKNTEVMNRYDEPLPGSRDEIKGILQALKLPASQASLYLQQAASEDNLKKVHAPSVLHIATHGFFSADVVQLNDQVKNDFMFHSGIILSSGKATGRNFDNDGIVTAYEVMSLDLTGTELVVLSACETGLGKVENSEGVYGLQRSFLQAGANNVMISLWKVEDMMTKDLMVRFYSYLARHHNQYDAFKRAQLDMMHSVKNPRLWGGFVMVSGN